MKIKTNRLIGYTHSLEYNIEKFIRQGLTSKRIEIDCELPLVQYDWTDELLKHAYLTQNSNEYQVRLKVIHIENAHRRNNSQGEQYGPYSWAQ